MKFVKRVRQMMLVASIYNDKEEVVLGKIGHHGYDGG